MSDPRPIHSHGPGGYNRGCRCPICSEATAKRHREGLEARVAKGLDPGDPRHGTYNGYHNWRCRCSDCRAAGAIRNAEEKERRR